MVGDIKHLSFDSTSVIDISTSALLITQTLKLTVLPLIFLPYTLTKSLRTRAFCPITYFRRPFSGERGHGDAIGGSLEIQ